HRYTQVLYATYLAEALFLTGDLAQARGVLNEGLELAVTANFQYGTALSYRLLGRFAIAEGAFAEARERFIAARGIFVTIEAPHEIGGATSSGWRSWPTPKGTMTHSGGISPKRTSFSSGSSSPGTWSARSNWRPTGTSRRDCEEGIPLWRTRSTTTWWGSAPALAAPSRPIAWQRPDTRCWCSSADTDGARGEAAATR